MRNRVFVLLLFIQATITLQAQELVPLSDCKGSPYFVTKLSPPGMKTYLSTIEKYKIGLYVVEQFPKDPKSPQKFSYPSWKDGGTLGSFVIAPTGHVYVCPTPYINNYFNPPCKQNILYRIHSNTGEMKPVFQFYGDSVCTDFGLMGISYDCESDLLFVSSIKGSDRNQVKGKIYSLLCTQDDQYQLIDSLCGIDAIGLSLVKVEGVKKLFFGDLRDNCISSIELNKNGKFISKPTQEIRLDDDRFMVEYKAKKISFSQENTIKINLIPFDYNFSVPGSDRTSFVEYRYNKGQKNWSLIKFEFN